MLRRWFVEAEGAVKVKPPRQTIMLVLETLLSGSCRKDHNLYLIEMEAYDFDINL